MKSVIEQSYKSLEIPAAVPKIRLGDNGVTLSATDCERLHVLGSEISTRRTTAFKWGSSEEGVGVFQIVQSDDNLYNLRAAVFRACLLHAALLVEKNSTLTEFVTFPTLQELLQDFQYVVPVKFIHGNNVDMSIRLSTIPGAGFGLFANKEIAQGTLLCALDEFATASYRICMTGSRDTWTQSPEECFADEATRQLQNYWTNRQSSHWNDFVKEQLIRTLRGWLAGPHPTYRAEYPGPDREEMKHVYTQIRNVVGFRPLPNENAPYAPVRNLINHPYVVEHPVDTIVRQDGNGFYVAKLWHDPVGTVWGYMNQPSGGLTQGNVDTKIVVTSEGQRLYWYATQTIPANTELFWYYGDQYNMQDKGRQDKGSQGAAAPNPRAELPSTASVWDDRLYPEPPYALLRRFSALSDDENSDDSNDDDEGVLGGIDRGFDKMSLRF